jgi:hypothetical protein
MRRSKADYAAIEAALFPYQHQALLDYAAARGCSHWRDVAVGCVVASTLAADNIVALRCADGEAEQVALLSAAAALGLDPETLRRTPTSGGAARDYPAGPVILVVGGLPDYYGSYSLRALYKVDPPTVMRGGNKSVRALSDPPPRGEMMILHRRVRPIIEVGDDAKGNTSRHSHGGHGTCRRGCHGNRLHQP